MKQQPDASSTPVSRRYAVGLAGALTLAGSSLALAGCSNSDSPASDASDASDTATSDVQSSAGEGATLVMALSVDPDGLDPQRTAAAATFEITNNVYDPLIRVDADNNLVPGLAQSWEVSDDGLSATFHLREGVAFSNGNPCDAAAVVASFLRLQAEDSPRVSEYANYSFSYDEDDPTTVTVESGTLNVAMLTDFAYAWAAVVDVSVADTLANKPVGTGPYTVESWTPQQALTLKVNPSYWGERPMVETVELRILPDATSQAASLRAGDIDLMQVDEYTLVDQFANDTAFQVLQFPMNGVQLMAMNCANEALSDVRVRQAVNMAVDKDALIEAVWWGYGEKIGSHYPPVLAGYVDCNDVYAYDPDAARALLEEAGYGDGLTLRMRLPESYPTYVAAGQVIADSLGKVGVTCDIEIIEWSTWLDEVYTGRSYDLTVVGHTGRLDPVTLLARYASDSSENYFNYANDEVDRLLTDYRGELDEEARAGYVERIQRILAEEVPALYIQTPVMVYLADKALQGFSLYPVDVYEFSDVVVGA